MWQIIFTFLIGIGLCGWGIYGDLHNWKPQYLNYFLIGIGVADIFMAVLLIGTIL